jgi:hypothetical protein
MASTSKPRSSRANPSRVKVREHREGPRRQGLRPIQIWVPDVHAPAFRSADGVHAIFPGTRAPEARGSATRGRSFAAVSRAQLQLFKRIFGRNRTEGPAIADGRLQGLRDDEGMPLICPTCQLFFEAFMPRHAACYFAWGCFRYFRERSCRRFPCHSSVTGRPLAARLPRAGSPRISWEFFILFGLPDPSFPEIPACHLAGPAPAGMELESGSRVMSG